MNSASKIILKSVKFLGNLRCILITFGNIHAQDFFKLGAPTGSVSRNCLQVFQDVLERLITLYSKFSLFCSFCRKVISRIDFSLKFFAIILTALNKCAFLTFKSSQLVVLEEWVLKITKSCISS
jgi:hypothetical protein